jgi:alcohol dehydrogenase class IV
VGRPSLNAEALTAALATLGVVEPDVEVGADALRAHAGGATLVVSREPPSESVPTLVVAGADPGDAHRVFGVLESTAVFLRGYTWAPSVDARRVVLRDVRFGRGSILRAGELAGDARRVAAIFSPSLSDTDRDLIEHALGRSLSALRRPAGALTEAAVASLVQAVKPIEPDLVVGAGGGTVLDATKAVAARLGVRSILIPTTLSGAEHTGNAAIWVGEKKTVTRVGPGNAVVADPDLLMRDLDVLGATALHATAHSLTIRRDRTYPRSLHALALAAFDDLLVALESDAADDATRARLLRGAWNAGVAIGITGPRFGPHHAVTHRVARRTIPHARLSAAVLCSTLLETDLYESVLDDMPTNDAANRMRHVAARWVSRLDVPDVKVDHVDIGSVDEEWRGDAAAILGAFARGRKGAALTRELP